MEDAKPVNSVDDGDKSRFSPIVAFDSQACSLGEAFWDSTPSRRTVSQRAMEVAMGLHHFHCSDGVDLVIDRKGRHIDGRQGLLSGAWATARALMRDVPGYDEWDNWSVYVYDECGEAEIVPFPTPLRMAA